MGGAPCATLRLEHRLPPGIAHRRAVPRRLATAAALCRRLAWLPRLCCVCLGVSTRGKKSAGAGRRWCVNEWLVDAPAHAQNTAVGVSTRDTPTHTRHTCGSLSQRGGRPRKWCGRVPPTARYAARARIASTDDTAQLLSLSPGVPLDADTNTLWDLMGSILPHLVPCSLRPRRHWNRSS